MLFLSNNLNNFLKFRWIVIEKFSCLDSELFNKLQPFFRCFWNIGVRFFKVKFSYGTVHECLQSTYPFIPQLHRHLKRTRGKMPRLLQCGHVRAESDTWFLHSGQLTSDIYQSPTGPNSLKYTQSSQSSETYWNEMPSIMPSTIQHGWPVGLIFLKHSSQVVAFFGLWFLKYS